MGRTPCCEKNALKKGPWTQEEDQKLIDYIQKHGCGNWRVLPKNAGLQRCGKSCRLRWTNYLRPDIKRGRFSFEEEETIIQLHSILGNKWSAIAGRLPGRTDNEIKNYWNTHIRKKLLRMGIDPVTHTPRLDLLDFSSILNPPLFNSSQLNVSRLLGGQPSVNPEVLRIVANSLLSSQYTVKPSELVDQNLLMSRNLQGSQLTHSQVQNQSPSLVQNISCGPFSNEAQLMQQANVEQFSSNMSNFSSQDCKLNEWQNQGMLSDLTEDYNYPLQNYGYYQQDQSIKDPPPSDASVFQSNDSSVSYQSVLSTLSTPSSSPTPLHSNSSYINSTTNEDERESYCSNMFNFDIQNILDVNALL